MINFDKKDIPVLDFIIEKSIEKYPEPIYLIDLIDGGFIIQKSKSLAVIFSNEIDEFERLVFIMSKYDCADCKIIPRNVFNERTSITKNEKTIQFKLQGGFKKTYNDLKKPLDWYRIVPIILTIIFGLLTFYFAYRNYELKLEENRVPSLIRENDSLKIELNRLKNKLIVNKEKPLLDTLTAPRAREQNGN